jgi:hypothetical protein
MFNTIIHKDIRFFDGVQSGELVSRLVRRLGVVLHFFPSYSLARRPRHRQPASIDWVAEQQMAAPARVGGAMQWVAATTTTTIQTDRQIDRQRAERSAQQKNAPE